MIPSTLLNTDAVLEPFEGDASLDGVYGEKVQIKGRFDGKRRLVKRADGSEIISSGTLLVRPDLDVPMKSRITIDGRAYSVEEVLPAKALNHIHHLELLLS
ncbi:MAG: hypothetical protein ACYC5F_09755 [Thermoleophilia bacterium]